LLGGKLFLDVDGAKLSEKEKEFRLKTPVTILAVKGTRFFAETGEDFETAGVHEGNVMMMERESGNSVGIPKGKAAMAKPGAVTKPRAMTQEEKALSEIYEGFSYELVLAEGGRRTYEEGDLPGRLKFGRGAELDGGRAITVNIEPSKAWEDMFSVMILKLPKKIPSEPLGLYFMARYKGINQFGPTGILLWGDGGVGINGRTVVKSPPGVAPGEWASYYVPFETERLSIEQIGDSGSMRWLVEPYPAKGQDPDAKPPAAGGEAEWFLELGPVYYVVEAEK
jgi:hypothetical protein